MGALPIMVQSPCFDFLPSVFQGQEPAFVQTLLAPASIEGVYETVVGGPPWPAAHSTRDLGSLLEQLDHQLLDFDDEDGG